jgi:hypothetical protein
MARPIQSFLEEFQLLPPPEPVHDERPARPLPETRRGASATDEAWRRGYEAGYAQAQAEADARLAEALAAARDEAREEGRVQAAQETREAVTGELQAAHEQALEAARAAWVAEEATRLSTALQDGFDALRTRLAEKTVRALEPFLAKALRDKACAEMATMLERLFAGGEAGTEIHVTGPQDLLDALRAALPDRPDLVIHIEPERSDIRISCAETTLETQIAQWSRILSGDVKQA